MADIIDLSSQLLTGPLSEVRLYAVPNASMLVFQDLINATWNLALTQSTAVGAKTAAITAASGMLDPTLAPQISGGSVSVPSITAPAVNIPANITVPSLFADWKTEYLDYIISIKIVDSIEDAIDHINTYGSGHTDVILSRSKDNISKFLKYVDSGDVFVNCSTRFSDGFRYGFGAEVGISTNKIHARGPVGLEGLVTYKYMLMGDGHIVADYAENRKSFTHRPLKKEFRI